MRYAAKKTISLIITLLFVSFLAFLAFQVIPGDPTTKLLGVEYTPERAQVLREQLGLEGSAVSRYFLWLGGFFSGNLGTSYSYSQPVSQLLGDKLSVTGLLSLMTFIITIAVSLPLGIFLASREGTAAGRISTVINQIIMSVPPFFMGILITLLFGLVLKWFTPGGYVSWAESPGKCLSYLIFPAVSIALPKIAMTVKLLKSSIRSEMDKDYVRTARSRGGSSTFVLFTHVLRNALIPTITFLAMTAAEIVAGSIIIEQVFSVPGLGRLLISSISNRDYPVVQAIIMIIAALVMVLNYLADMAYQLVDPRIRLEGGQGK